ncbi:alpha-N-acetylgalactosaminidase [Manduca sexta]|uniref:alpha-N-acetylgalactosaminidase n=2 Tax=Manduca sexta TaxID=7130 RepID=UPI00188F606A|nr:alpha-N-acetylgalactosaminidase [Manduca sexta]
MVMRKTIFMICFTSVWNGVCVLENGLARTPPMGWMSWGYYMCGVDCERYPDKCLDERLILSVVDSFYNEGYQEAGYEYIIIDDCWSEKQRDKHGRLVPDAKRFPHGMKYIADYIHERGLKFGMYTNIAAITCMKYPGSKDHFKVDAKTFAEWGVDYLKVDGCYVGEDYLNQAYVKLGSHLNETGRPMVYSCSWPYYIEFIHNKTPNLTAVSAHCNMWRNYHDVSNSWGAIKAIAKYYETNYEILAPHHGPGHWNDPDMLILGTGSLSESQTRVHVAVHAMLSGPLLLSCDMGQITSYERSLLQNLDLIAINQDPLGIMAKPYSLHEPVTMWMKPHFPMKGDIYPSYSVAFVNMGEEDGAVSFAPSQFGLNCTDGYSVMDVFTGVFLKNITLEDEINITVPPEDVILYSLFPL